MEHSKIAYQTFIYPLIWKCWTSTQICEHFKIHRSKFHRLLTTFGTPEDVLKNKQTSCAAGKIQGLETRKKNNVPHLDNLRRIELSRQRYHQYVKQMIYDGFTSKDIAKHFGFSDFNRINYDTKRFGTPEEREQLLQNGINKRKQILTRMVETKTSAPEKMLYDIVKEIYPSAQHKFKIANNKRYFYELDVAVPEIKLDFEYDGEFWHHRYVRRDQLRDEFLASEGWKVFRFVYKENPSYDTLYQAVKDQVASLSK